jgi:hypothetical protein
LLHPCFCHVTIFLRYRNNMSNSLRFLLNSSSFSHRKQWNPFYSDVSLLYEDGNAYNWYKLCVQRSVDFIKIITFNFQVFHFDRCRCIFLVYRLCCSEHYLYYLISLSIFHVAKSLNCVFWLDIIILEYMSLVEIMILTAPLIQWDLEPHRWAPLL